MRLLTLSMEYPPTGGGGAPVIQGLAHALSKRGYQIDVVTARMPDLPRFEQVNGFAVHRVASFRRRRSQAGVFELGTYVLPALRRAKALTAQKHYDLAHVHFAVPSGAVAYALKRRTDIPYVITIHGSDVPAYNPDRFTFAHSLIRPAWRRIARGAAAVVSPSRYLADLFTASLPDVPVQTIPNGFSPPGVTGPTCKRDRILVVTRLFERKGVHHFLEAIRDLDTSWEIVIAGDGPERAGLEALARGIRPAVRFAGQVDHAEVLELCRTSKIFVFPSVQENFPSVLLEAMWAGCAIITTTAYGCVEVVGDAALQTACSDPRSIRAALDRLLACPALVQELACRAQMRVRDFAWPGVAERYDECFRRVVAGG
jgi:L-malate glycosyltransferase